MRGLRLKTTITLGLLALTALVAAPAAGASASVSPSPWYQDGWNQSRAGFNPQETQLTATLAHALHQVWRVQTPDPCCEGPQTSSVVSVGGTAYFAGASGDVRAVNVVTGAQKWRVQAPECVVASAGPALYMGVLLVPTQACTPDDFNSWLTAYRPSTGQELWSHKAVNSMSAPLTRNGVAYVESSAPANIGLRRLDAIDVATGAVRWHRGLGGQTPALAADGTNLYLSSATTLMALDPVTGAFRWSRSVPGGNVLTSAGHVVVAGTSAGSEAIASYTQSGHRQWATSLVGSVGFSIAATGGEVVIADRNGMVQALDLAGGGFSWFTSFSTAVTSQPTIAGGVVYVTLATPTSSAVYALRDGTGAILWHFTDPAAAADAADTASPSVAAGTLFVSLGSGIVRAFRP
jgi:outer membrane protein assembly factor BamB